MTLIVKALHILLDDVVLLSMVLLEHHLAMRLLGVEDLLLLVLTIVECITHLVL